MRRPLVLLFAMVCGSFGAACASTPAAPFDSIKTANVTAYRLQNYEPPPAASAAPPAVGGFGLPPEIQRWVQAGASMLPPGLLPPGLIPGQPPTSAPAADTTPRFNGFRILAQAQVIDEKDRGELGDIFGLDSHFDDTFSSCMFAEFGVRMERSGAPPDDVLVSYSCDRVQSVNFTWPHRHSGLKPDTVQRITKLMQKIWGNG